MSVEYFLWKVLGWVADGVFLSFSGIKEYSNWPTIPQVYLNGEFLGGCDILLDMHKNGDLIEELQKVGIRSALLDKHDDDKKE